jgi:hypothetical protein
VRMVKLALILLKHLQKAHDIFIALSIFQ